MAESRSGGARRRVFSAEVKLEAVRGMEERRSRGMNLTRTGRELGVRPDQLRKWKRQHDCRAGAAESCSTPCGYCPGCVKPVASGTAIPCRWRHAFSWPKG